MSFNIPTITMTFSQSHNGACRAPGGANTYLTDFETGRSWVQPLPYLRLYRDGVVALYHTGRREPLVRRELFRHGIEVVPLSEITGKLFRKDGTRVTRTQIGRTQIGRTQVGWPPDTVLIEGDRLYPLQYHYYASRGQVSPQAALPKPLRHDDPVVVWTDRTAMPVCASQFTTVKPSKERYDAWKAEHMEKVNVQRAIGKLQGNPDGLYTPARNLNFLLKDVARGGELTAANAWRLSLQTQRAIDKSIEWISAEETLEEYLILKE